MLPAKHTRAIHLIRQAVKSLGVDLSDQVVLTEVGSNNYLYTPIIAALCGARQVYAWTRDTAYGKARDISDECQMIARHLGVDGSINFALNAKPEEHVRQANIITNSGFLRPLNEQLLSKADPQNCVIPVMYEAWELRDSDLDIDYCRTQGFKVAGTWENHPSIGVFDGCGPLAVKLAMEAGFEVYQNHIIVFSEDDFGKGTAECFEKFGASKVTMTTDPEVVWQQAETADFIYFCDYHEQRTLLGHNGLFDLQRLASINSAIGVVHLYGEIDNQVVKAHGLRVYPDKPGKALTMTESLAYLGQRPVINLQVAGFKVAQCLAQKIEHSLVQDLSTAPDNQE